MDSETIEEVTGWDSVPVGGGYRGLHDLADDEFSGAVSCGSTWAFLLNGRVVGVFDGSIEQFEDGDLTAYAAPDPALPLLFAMQELGGETRAKYYTNDTPLAEAHETLSSGSFTGYVELSENVLSGDYYVVYHGGKSMSAAYVGSSRRLFTGDEAFERANDEVGIYHVRQVDLEIVDIPEVESSADEASAAAAATTDESETADDAGATTRDAVTFGQQDDADADAEAADAASDPTPAADSDSTTDADSDSTTDADSDSTTDAETPRNAETTTDADPAADAEATDARAQSKASMSDQGPSPEAEAADQSAASEAAQSGASAPEATGETAAERRPASDGEAAEDDPREWVDDFPDEQHDESATDDDDDVFSEEAKWREARSIPALDPDETAEEADGSGSGSQARVARKRRSNAESSASSDTQSTGSVAKRSGGSSARQPRGSGSKSSRSSGGSSRASPGQLRKRLEAVVEERDELRKRLQQAKSAREQLESERDELERERDEAKERAASLESRVAELESEVDRLESALESTADAGGHGGSRTMSPREALEGTNLFVRYDRKSEGTLEAVHAGQADREKVNQNLRIDFHTTFDTTDLTVEGEPFAEYLRNTIEYGFVEWLVRDLLYEIRDTNNEHSLEALYDAIPKIDRIELRGVVSGDAPGDDEPESRRFDVVLWDGMGNPLIVANLNDSRNAATQSMVSSLVENANWVAEHDDTLGAACFVTSSFFDPEALDVAAEATGSGLLSRSKRKAFVKLSRKSGFHICLVEGRNEEFYVNFPDL